MGASLTNQEAQMTMPDGNSAAESSHAHETAKREELAEQFYEKALEDLVWRVMDGQTYPKSAHWSEQTYLMVILKDADAIDVAGAICAELHGHGYTLRQNIEAIVKDYLRDSRWHEIRIAEMIEEARDDEV